MDRHCACRAHSRCRSRRRSSPSLRRSARARSCRLRRRCSAPVRAQTRRADRTHRSSPCLTVTAHNPDCQHRSQHNQLHSSAARRRRRCSPHPHSRTDTLHRIRRSQSRWKASARSHCLTRHRSLRSHPRTRPGSGLLDTRSKHEATRRRNHRLADTLRSVLHRWRAPPHSCARRRRSPRSPRRKPEAHSGQRRSARCRARRCKLAHTGRSARGHRARPHSRCLDLDRSRGGRLCSERSDMRPRDTPPVRWPSCSCQQRLHRLVHRSRRRARCMFRGTNPPSMQHRPRSRRRRRLVAIARSSRACASRCGRTLGTPP